MKNGGKNKALDHTFEHSTTVLDLRHQCGWNYLPSPVRNSLLEFIHYIFEYRLLTWWMRPGLPRFSRSSASMYYTEHKPKRKKRGRPGNEAIANGIHRYLERLHVKYLAVKHIHHWLPNRSLRMAVCHGKNGPPKLVPPGTYFTEKYGLPLKNLDHLPQMKNVDPEHTCKFGPVAYLGGFPRYFETTQARKFSST